MENKELLDARKSKKLAEALTDKIVKNFDDAWRTAVSYCE